MSGSAIVSVAGYARRSDVLLRARFPLLRTRIFELSPDHHVIAVEGAGDNFPAIASEFDQTIRPAAWHIELASTPPESFLREVPGLTDAEAAGGYAGLPLTVNALNTLILSRFPDLPIVGARDEPREHRLAVLISAPIPSAKARFVLDFVASLELPLTPGFDLIEVPPRIDPQDDAPPPYGRPREAMLIRPAKRRRAAPGFVAADEAFWFENLTAAAAGRHTGAGLLGLSPDSYRCFFDFTTGRHLQLRQALLLYDEVYCSLPLAENHEAFLARQALTETDLLDLVAAGRLRIVSTQPEERLHLPCLEEIAERNPGAVIGRRSAALLLLADVASTAEHYRLDDARFRSALQAIAEHLAPRVHLSPQTVLRLLLWPSVARRQSLHPILEQGTKAGPAAELAEALSEAVAHASGVEIRLQAMVLSERVHVGHALEATVFPALDEPAAFAPLMQAIGQELNFYRGFNTDIVAAWAANERRRREGVEILPAIPLLEFDPKTPISEILEAGRLPSTRAKGRALIARLANMAPADRPDAIDALADRLRHVGRRSGGLLSLDNLDTSISIASLVGNFFWPGPVGAARLAGGLLEPLRRVKAVDTMLHHLEQDFAALRGRNEDLHFLSKVQRVALLKRDRV